jgi:hypothetical protein
MRPLLCFALLLAGCSREPAQPSIATGTFAGQGRDRLCIAGDPGAYRAGLIAYGGGDANCSAAGKLEASPAGWVLIPKGEGDCKIPLAIEGDAVRVGQVSAACTYYCGPGATLADKSFTRSDKDSKAVDLAGDPLC